LSAQQIAANEEIPMLEGANDKLTDRERECVKHIGQARERGMSFAEYCRSAGLKANEWHGVRHGMVKKKLLPPGPGTRSKSVPSRRKPARFIPVRVEPSSGTGSSIGMLCRVRHPSGCIIECVSWPELTWMRGLLEAKS
jgi:hypothetical protein